MSELALRLIAENKAQHARGEDATYLDLGNCGLTHLPSELGGCVWVEVLVLSNKWTEYDVEKKVWEIKQSQNSGEPNYIVSIAGVEDWRLLKKLVVSKYHSDPGKKWELCDLSPLAALKQLQQLYCSSTLVSDLSPLAALEQLQKLDCSYTYVSDLSPLAALKQLQQLDCSYTPVSNLSPLADLKQLEKLYCSSTLVSDLSPLADLEQLRELYCFDTYVSDLSPLELLSSLRLLSCNGYSIDDLSPLKKLIGIETLKLSNIIYSGNRENFKHIDIEMIKLWKNIKTLWISTFNIGDLSFISNLPYLEELNIATSNATHFDALASLKKLRILNCSGNDIANLEFTRYLPNLRFLDCANTQVSDLSPLISLIKKGVPVRLNSEPWRVDGIHLQNCPLTNPPQEIVKQGNEAILNYFAEKQRAGTEKSLEAKVVLVGEGQAGKTSLRTRLLRPGEALPNKEDRTKGLDIEIEKYRYPLVNGEEMRLNVFDFGGQDHYKPLHQFFYSKNTLYVLVSKNGDAAVNDFDYWLDTAQLFGQNSPVLLVHNLFGDVRSSFNRAKYARFDATIKECLDVNLGDFKDKRWKEVQSRIEYFASRLPHVHEEIPKSWANVRRTLAARREEQVIDLEDYLTLCSLEENGGMDEARALHCSAYLHDIGVILHYQDDADLREYVIVKNEWATDAAYRVIDDPDIEKRKGHFFRQTDLPRIWYQPEYKKMRPQLLELMKRFRLCYPLKAEGEFIAPQLLPNSPPEGYAWQEAQDLILYVEYDFMPLGLMAQLIVECHLLIAAERRLVWRDGAVLELLGGEARAEILLQKRNGKQTIGIRAQGSKRRDLMTVIDSKLEELHKPFGNGLKFEKKIPCVCPRCEKTEDKWFFNLSELEYRMSKGRNTQECGISLDDVSIDELLGNVFSKPVHRRGGVDTVDCSLLKELIAEGNTEQAIHILLKISEGDKDTHGMVIGLSARLKDVKRQETKGIIKTEVSQLERNQINDGLLGLIAGLEG